MVTYGRAEPQPQNPCGPQSLESSLSGPLQKKNQKPKRDEELLTFAADHPLGKEQRRCIAPGLEKPFLFSLEVELGLSRDSHEGKWYLHSFHLRLKGRTLIGFEAPRCWEARGARGKGSVCFCPIGCSLLRPCGAGHDGVGLQSAVMTWWSCSRTGVQVRGGVWISKAGSTSEAQRGDCVRLELSLFDQRLPLILGNVSVMSLHHSHQGYVLMFL